MDREALLRRRRELYRQRRERETLEEKEVRLSGRRENITGNLQLRIQNHVPTTFIPHARMHVFSGSPLDAVSICLVVAMCSYRWSQ